MRNKKHKTFAVVFGDIDMLRPLGLAGIPCAVVAGRGHLPRYSRFATKVLEWSDPWKNPTKLLETLVAFGSAQKTKPILFYQSDADLVLISRNRELLSRYFRFVIPDSELVEDLVDKSRFQNLAERLSLPVPNTRLLSATFSDYGHSEWTFPLLVKPLTRKTANWKPIAGLGKAVRINSLKEMDEFRSRFASFGGDFLVQELIPGEESEIESYHVYVDELGEIAGEFTGKKIRTFPREFGQSCALTISGAEDVVKLGRELTAKLRLHGVAKFDFKRAPDGKLVLLEVNPRFNLWHHLAAIAGLNLPEVVYCDLVGLPRPSSAYAKPGVIWCRVWLDFFAARNEGITIFNWLKWVSRCEARPGFSWDDPMPVIGAGVSRSLTKLGSIFRRGEAAKIRESNAEAV